MTTGNSSPSQSVNGVSSDDESISAISFGGFTYDDKRKCLVSSDGSERRLRAQSLEVFVELARTPNQIVSRAHLLETVWSSVNVTDDSIGKCIADIRKALSDSEHAIVKTIPRQGYMLIADPVKAAPPEKFFASRWLESLSVGWFAVGLLMAIVGFFVFGPRNNAVDTQSASVIQGIPRVLLSYREDSASTAGRVVSELIPELRVALSRYRTLELTDSTDADYRIELKNPADNRLTVELQTDASSVVFAQTYENTEDQGALVTIAHRIASAIASPGVGALDRQILESSRLKPVESLSHAECFVHGFGCSKCSGEEDNITKRAEACLDHILENDPDNARALALQATIYAHQYWWGNTLAEPLRSHLKLRKHLPDKAIKAANDAEALSAGDDSAIYWGMTEAYYSSCQTDKMIASIERGLEINPNDPNMLAAFGNWMSYSGRWDEGAAMTQRALDIEPRHYRRWWWMGLAKTHYFKGEYLAAYADFLKAFNERNWISHLQLAYTLPYLDRMDEARHAVARLQDLAPQITVERALEHYEILCFPDSFLEKMKHGLQLAGLPSRGNSNNFSDIKLPRANTLQLSGYNLEYLDHGEGEPVVFVHGTLSDYRSWGYYLVPVSENHRFISYSRRYFGTQDWPDDGEHFKSEIHGKDLIEFVEQLDIGPVHLVSWSTGVITAMLASLERPDLFKSAIHFEPVDVAIFADQELDSEQMNEWDKRWDYQDEAMDAGDLELGVERFIEIVFQSGPGGFEYEREPIKEIFRQNAKTVVLEHAEPDETRWTLDCDKVSDPKIPTLILKGEQSHYFYTRLAELFAECSGSELVTIPNVNHRGPLDAVVEITESITRFVDKNR